jgi:hypothetical protein
VYDLGDTGPQSAPPLGAWQTQLTVLRRLDESTVTVLRDSHVVLLCRLSSAEAGIAASAIRMPGRQAGLLEGMGRDMLAVIGGGADHIVALSQTPVEYEQIPPPGPTAGR